MVQEGHAITVQIMDITKTYGQMKVVDAFSLNIQQGEIITLLGHNGAGKSTLLKILTGQLSATSGDVQLNFKSIKKDRDEVRKL